MYVTYKRAVGPVGLIQYNETKEKSDQGQCIYAGNFYLDGIQLSGVEKIQALEDRNSLNHRTSADGISIILKFPNTRILDDDTLIDIAVDFLKGIGFGGQPHFIYSHYDLAFPHLHIITTPIKYDGSYIPQHDIVKRVIQPVRREIMAKYDLKPRTATGVKLHDPRQKIQYGKTYIHQAMAATIEYVMNNFQYRSLEAFRAILHLYNLDVYAGLPNSWLRQHRGLVYMVTDDNGKRLNAPIRASKFSFKPTLKNLEQRFTALELPDPSRARRQLGELMKKEPVNIQQVSDHLRLGRLAMVPLHDGRGKFTDLFFIDLAGKCAISPAELGPQFEPDAIRKTLGFDPFVKTPSPKHNREQVQAVEIKTEIQPLRQRGRHQ